ncbi:MAG: hypothetical protein EKK40_18305 [Bradyrhizobiaceae bacterium]|nr:MAG: hypothetical protein EKK40_18305 [Bradyrhizobiaceae bacterium]
MNHSFYSADRMTHLKIVVVALVAAIGVAVLGISAHVTAGDSYMQAANTPVIKATRTMMITSSDQQVIR